MVSKLHEGLAELFRHQPALAAELLSGPLHVELPKWEEARLYSADFTDRNPVEARADEVITLVAADTIVAGLIVEVQLRPDLEKRRSWPAYLGNLYRRLGCNVFLLVVCPTESVARRCATPIKLGHPGCVLAPLVLGPERVPLIVDSQQAKHDPELAVLSAMAHGGGPAHERVLRTMLDGLGEVDGDHISLYTDVVMAVLPRAARQSLEALMNLATYEPISPYFRRQRREGEAEGRAEALLEVLAAREITVPDRVRSQILTCTDRKQLSTWIRRAVTATTIDEVVD